VPLAHQPALTRLIYAARPDSQATEQPNERAAVYWDGFNLYYAISDLRKNYLKWANLRKLSAIILPGQALLTKTVFFTAYNKKDYDRLTRHRNYVKALEYYGVSCIFGHYVQQPRECDNCHHRWTESSEKETDVNIALHVLHDAYENVFDHAYLVTADSDQAATVKMLKSKFPAKKVTTVAPPGRNFSANILRYADGKITLNADQLERAVMPSTLFAEDRTVVVRRPPAYAPPPSWVHPDPD
jgi:uncharacterized LabA/DUF88 family protein